MLLFEPISASNQVYNILFATPSPSSLYLFLNHLGEALSLVDTEYKYESFVLALRIDYLPHVLQADPVEALFRTL